MLQVQVQAGPTGPIALAGLVNSLHASSSACPPGPVSVVCGTMIIIQMADRVKP